MKKQINRVFVSTGSEYLTTSELAAYLNVGLSKARAISAAAMATSRIGRTTRHHKPTIDNYMHGVLTGNTK